MYFNKLKSHVNNFNGCWGKHPPASPPCVHVWKTHCRVAPLQVLKKELVFFKRNIKIWTFTTSPSIVSLSSGTTGFLSDCGSAHTCVKSPIKSSFYFAATVVFTHVLRRFNVFFRRIVRLVRVSKLFIYSQTFFHYLTSWAFSCFFNFSQLSVNISFSYKFKRIEQKQKSSEFFLGS